MSEFEQYTQSAKLAFDYANRAETNSDRQAWLSIAEGWLELIRPDEIASKQISDCSAF